MVSRSTNAKSAIPVLNDTYNNNANNLEMVVAMKMKIGHLQNKNRVEILNSILVNYKDTHHLSTCVASAHMLFRDGYRSNLPYNPIPYPISLSVKK